MTTADPRPPAGDSMPPNPARPAESTTAHTRARSGASPQVNSRPLDSVSVGHVHDPECQDCRRAADLLAMARGSATLLDDLRALAAAHHLGGWLNGVEDLAKVVGGDKLPGEVLAAMAAVLDMLAVLGLSGGQHPLRGDVWREAAQ